MCKTNILEFLLRAVLINLYLPISSSFLAMGKAMVIL